MTASSTLRGLRVTDLATAAGVSSDTVRYYERAGLLPPPARTPAGYRSYDAAAIDRLKFIQGAQRLGLRLREIADLLAVRDTGVCPSRPRSCCAAASPSSTPRWPGWPRYATNCRPWPMRCRRQTAPIRHQAPGIRPHPTREGGGLSMSLLVLTSCCDDPDCPPELCGCGC